MSKAKKIIFFVIIILIFLTAGIFVGMTIYLQKQGFITTLQKNGDIMIGKNSFGYFAIAPDFAQNEDIFAAVNKKTDFHVYYPVFIPEGVQLNKRGGIFWQENDPDVGTLASYNIGVPVSDSVQTDIIGIDSKSPVIWVIENKIDSTKPTTMMWLTKNYTNKKQDVLINGQKGFYVMYGGTDDKAFNLVYSTNDGNAIRIWSKDFNFDILKKIAESMK